MDGSIDPSDGPKLGYLALLSAKIALVLINAHIDKVLCVSD